MVDWYRNPHRDINYLQEKEFEYRNAKIAANIPAEEAIWLLFTEQLDYPESQKKSVIEDTRNLSPSDLYKFLNEAPVFNVPVQKQFDREAAAKRLNSVLIK